MFVRRPEWWSRLPADGEDVTAGMKALQMRSLAAASDAKGIICIFCNLLPETSSACPMRIFRELFEFLHFLHFLRALENFAISLMSASQGEGFPQVFAGFRKKVRHASDGHSAGFFDVCAVPAVSAAPHEHAHDAGQRVADERSRRPGTFAAPVLQCRGRIDRHPSVMGTREPFVNNLSVSTIPKSFHVVDSPSCISRQAGTT